MDHKMQQVFKWLENLSLDKKVPDFEVDEYTIGLLETLMRRNQQAEKDALLRLEDAKRKWQEYEAESKRIGSILKDFGMVPDGLEPDIQAPLNALCRTAQLLDVEDTTSASASVQMYTLLKESRQLELDLAKSEESVADLVESISNALKFSEELNRVERKVREDCGNLADKLNKEENQVFYNVKMKTYIKQIKQLDAVLSRSGFSPSLEHQAILKQHKKYQQLMEELAKIQKNLRCYHDLPPDAITIKQKIAEAEAQLESLQEELSKYYNTLHD